MRLVSLVLLILVSGCSLLMEPADSETLSGRAPLFFHEEWMEVPASRPVKQEHLQNKKLIVALHGPDRLSIGRSHHDNIPNDPWYIWSGNCKNGRWGMA